MGISQSQANQAKLIRRLQEEKRKLEIQLEEARNKTRKAEARAREAECQYFLTLPTIHRQILGS